MRMKTTKELAAMRLKFTINKNLENLENYKDFLVSITLLHSYHRNSHASQHD